MSEVVAENSGTPPQTAPEQAVLAGGPVVDTVATLSPAQLAEFRQLALEDFYFFSKGVLGYDWLNDRIHMPICRMLEQAETTNKTEFLIVLPRGWQKSTLVSICYPIWRAIRNCNVTILLVQNTATNATAKLEVIRHHFETNAFFRMLFPEILPNESCDWKQGHLEVNRTRKTPEATFECTGIGTAIVGRHYDEVIEDDTVAPDADDMDADYAMPSKEQIQKAIGFHNSLASILVDIKRSRSIVIGTRWAEQDLIAYIIKQMGDDLEYYERAVRETNGKADERGQLTFPERFDDIALTKLAKKWGPYMYSCLYMNKPIRSTDMVFQPEWLQYFEIDPLKLVKYTKVDLASDPENLQTSDPDFTVVITTGKDMTTGRIYVLDYTRERCNPGRQVEMIFEHVERHKPIKVALPKVAYEQSLQYWLEEEMRRRDHFFNTELVTTGGKSKELRILGLQPLFSSRTIYLRQWMRELGSELLAFPMGAHDDIIDALAMGPALWGLTKVARAVKVPVDDNPLSFERGARELREKHAKAEGFFGDLVKQRTFSTQELLMSMVN